MMNQVVPADIDMSESIVRRALLEQFGLVVDSLRILGEGWDNLVYLVNDSLVFRFPRRLEAVELIGREITFLTALASHVNLKIPAPTYIGQPSDIFPRPFYAHPFLPGISGCSIHLSPAEYKAAIKTLAQFLRTLHDLNPTKLNLSSKDLTPVYDRADWPKMESIFLKRLGDVEKNYTLKEYQEKIASILLEAQDYKPTEQPRIIHGDMYHRHLLFDEQHRLNAVIDWGDAAVGDYVADLGVVYQFFPKSIHEDFFAIYGPVPNKAKQYARFLGLYYAMALLWYGHDRQDKDLIRTSLWTIKHI